MKEITAKQILIPAKEPAQWFDIHFNMNLYRGCLHGCIYCDSRSVCYQLNDFEEIELKVNALDILRQELASKQRKTTIGTGSMSDPYNIFEEKMLYTRQALQIISDFNFPIHINTKSTLILRDIDLLNKINRRTLASAAISFSTVDDELAAILEPQAPSPSERLKAVKQLNQAGIYTGILFTPVLPFITDDIECVRKMIDRAAEAGAKYIISWFGVSLREGSREYFYSGLAKLDEKLVDLYKNTFGNQYSCLSPDRDLLWDAFVQSCSEKGIAYQMSDVKTYSKMNYVEQLTIF
jgi:DNA repair photolyase